MHREIFSLPDVVRDVLNKNGPELRESDLLAIQFKIFEKTGCIVDEEKIKLWHEKIYANVQ